MKIVVLVKQTPETEARINIASTGDRIDETGMKYMVNPYDEYAIEEAIQIRDKAGAGEVVLVCFGPESAKERLLKGLAMGADRGVVISDQGLTQLDSLGVATVLSAAVRAEKPDLLFCGKQAIDDDNMHVGVMLAELLAWPHVNVVTKVQMDPSGSSATVEREVEGGQIEVSQIRLPAVLGAHKSLNTPRYAALPGIMKAKKKPMDQKSLSELGLKADELLTQSKTKLVGFRLPPEKPKGKVFKDDPLEVMVPKVVKLLREEAKVI